MSSNQPALSSESAMSQARNSLRQCQKEGFERAGLPPHSSGVSVVELALESLHHQASFEPTSDPNIVRRGIYKFDRQQELERLQLAEDLICRVDPGPYEDPTYLALLAFQAASIQMAFEFLADRSAAEIWSRFFLGTIHSPQVNAFARSFVRDRHVVIAMYSALVDLVYQAAKALVVAQNPVHSKELGVTLKSHTDVESIKAQLQINPEPVERLYKTFEAYFFSSAYPRAAWNEVVKDEQQPVLGTLISLAERFAIAHEYAHGFARCSDMYAVIGGTPAILKEECYADQMATILTVISADRLDFMPPEAALASSIFSLKCLDLLRRARCIIGEGQEPTVWTDDKHLPHRARAEAVVDTFYEFFDVTYENHRVRELRFGTGSEPRVPSDSVQEQIGHAFDYADGLQIIWEPVKQRLLLDNARKRPKHPRWSKDMVLSS